MSIIVSILWVILAVIVLLVTVLLIAPIHLLIDSRRSLYGIRMTAVAEGMLHMVNYEPVVDLWCCGYRRRIYLVKIVRNQIESRKRKNDEKGVQQASKDAQSASPADTTRKKRKVPWQRIRACLYSFRVGRMDLNIDTGIDEWNAYLLHAP